MDNLVSNFVQLQMMGLTIPQIVMGWREKFIEITEFVKNEEAMIKLEVDLAAMIKKDPVEAKKIQAKMAALRDANENMSIAPLIKAGEFSTISESLSEADVSIREGRWADFIENAVDKLPAGSVMWPRTC